MKYIDPSGHAPIVDEDENGNPVVDRDEAASQAQHCAKMSNAATIIASGGDISYEEELYYYSHYRPRLNSVADYNTQHDTLLLILMIWGEGRDLNDPAYGGWGYVREADIIAAWSVYIRLRRSGNYKEVLQDYSQADVRKVLLARGEGKWAYHAFGQSATLAPFPDKGDSRYWELAVQVGVGVKHGKIEDITGGTGYFFHDEYIVHPDDPRKQLGTRLYGLSDDPEKMATWSRPGR